MFKLNRTKRWSAGNKEYSLKWQLDECYYPSIQYSIMTDVFLCIVFLFRMLAEHEWA